MKTSKKIWKGIAGKLKNRKGSQITNTSEGAAIEEPRTIPEDVEKDSLKVKEQTSVTETDTQLYEDININNGDLSINQPTCKTSEKAQNSPTEQEPNTSNDLSSAEIEPCFDSNAADEKSSIRQRQAIIVVSAGVALLISSIVSYVLKMHIIAVVVGIVGLACVGFALYNSFKPNTKLEKVEDVEQPITVHPPLNPT